VSKMWRLDTFPKGSQCDPIRCLPCRVRQMYRVLCQFSCREILLHDLMATIAVNPTAYINMMEQTSKGKEIRKCVVVIHNK
jgi:hypothetical protein